MKILITGADGLLGSNVVRELLHRNHEVIAFIEKGRNAKTLNGLPISTVHGDILNAQEVLEATKNVDAVIHCAAYTAIWPAKSALFHKVNVEGTANIITACLKYNVQRCIFVGTANSFGSGNIHTPGNEKSAYKGYKYGLDYMNSKRKAQEMILEAVQDKGLKALIVNPTFMIGAYDSQPSSGAMIKALYYGKIPCYTNGGKNYINVKDAAIGIVNSLTKGRIGECYILGNENLTYQSMFKKIAAVIGRKAPQYSLPNFMVKTYGRIGTLAAKIFSYKPSVSYEMSVLSCEDHYYDAQKAVRELDLPQTPIENGIRDCFYWFKANQYLTSNA